MVGSTSSSSSSCASFGSFDDVSVKPSPAVSAGGTIKFLCSYGGKILPRHPDCKLRYVGGDTRVLSVDRFLPFSELVGKMREMCGWESVSVRCQLPTEDLDALVSVTSDEDVANLVEEYDLAAAASQGGDRVLKIRAFLFPFSAQVKTPKSWSPPSTPPHTVARSRSHHHHHRHHHVQAARASPMSVIRCVHHMSSGSGRHENSYAHQQYHHELQQNHQYAHHQPDAHARPQQFLVQHGSWD